MPRSFPTLALALALLAAPASAQDHPDMSGFWGADFTGAERPADLMAALPPNTGIAEDTGAAEFPRGVFGDLIPTEEARRHAEQWQPEQDMTIQRVCLPPSVVYAIQGPFPFEIEQFADVILMRYEYFDQTRLIYMDGREHPGPDYPHTKMGFSTGRWEGNDLVIDTSHIAASTITNNGLDHTDNVVMQERYRLTEGGNRLVATQWFSDPAVLVNNGARFISWSKRTGEHIFPYECDPSFALEYAQVGAE